MAEAIQHRFKTRGPSDVHLILVLLVGFVACASSVYAQSSTGSECQKVLIPTAEESHNDSRKIQAYMFLNSSYEYDRLKNGRDNQRRTRIL